MATDHKSKNSHIDHDVESNPPGDIVHNDGVDVRDEFQIPKVASGLWKKLSSAGVELRGAEPVPVDKRADTRYLNTFTVFASSLTSLQP